MKKVWVCAFILLFILGIAFIFFGKKLELDAQLADTIYCVLWAGCLVCFICALTCGGRTDGDLIAGAEDEDGLVFALSTPVEELIKKDIVVFKVVKERH